MPIIDGALFHESIADTTLVDLDPVTTDGDRIKNLNSPQQGGCIAYSADIQYLEMHNAQSFGATDPQIRSPGQLLTGVGRVCNINRPGAPMIPNSLSILRAYQDSGGAQEVNGIVWTYYNIGQSMPYEQARRKPYREFRITKGANVAADAWTTINTLRAGYELEPGQRYALLGMTTHSPDARAVYASHPQFSGLRPMLPGSSDVGKVGMTLENQHFPECPIFDGGSSLEIFGFAGAAQDMTVFVSLAKV